MTIIITILILQSNKLFINKKKRTKSQEQFQRQTGSY